ncbi:esterase/lipase family protein [Rubritalea squalenifaciens]|nr:hypothetical protein [Rubritalea squalenifaciens]
MRDANHYYQKLRYSKSSNTISKYNETCEALLLQDSCRDKNLTSLPPEIGTWLESKTNGYITPSYFDAIFPATQVFTEKFYEDHYRKGGVGVPLVGWKKNGKGKPNPPDFMAPSGRAFNLTAILSFENGKPLWKLYQAKHTESVTIGQTSHTLSGDFTAADAIFWDRSILKKNILEGLILPDRIFGETGLYMDAPYDPTKIPVLCVHGLKSSPDAFMFMVNDLRQDQLIRQHYQFVYFYYPTGAPWMYTAATFRDKVRELENYARAMGGIDNFNQMVILSHSMGGLISRASTCVSPKPFYDAVYDREIHQLRGSQRNRNLVKRLLYYETLKAPKRIVFMATPHKGSSLADWRVVNLFSRLIQLPTELSYSVINAALDTGANFVEGNIDNFNIPTSLDQLSPNNRMILAVPKLEFPLTMKIHSIIGARKGNPKSDGVVEYWSSHLPPRQTESELIINSDHSVPFKKEAIQEVNRILHLHLREAGKN